MNTELIDAVHAIEKERGVDSELIFRAIEESLVSAYKREVPGAKSNDNIHGVIDRDTGEMRIEIYKEIVENVTDPETQISLVETQAFDPSLEPGDVISVMVSTDQLGRLAAQAAKSVINQRLTEAESERIINEFSDRIGELAYGVVQRRDRREVIVDIGRAEAVLPYREQSRLDNYDFNQRMRFYIMKVDERHAKPIVLVSRSHPTLVRRLFEQEVPEIQDGTVEIVSIAREAGSRTKIAVTSNDPNVDAVGACVGQRGMRVQAVIGELNGEKIDVIEWEPDFMTFLSNALSPARVVQVVLYEEKQTASVVVPDHQLSLAIGRSGQNARLAAKLTGWKIDILSESQYHEMLEEQLLSHFDQADSDAEAENPFDLLEDNPEGEATEAEPEDFTEAISEEDPETLNPASDEAGETHDRLSTELESEDQA